MAARRCSEGWPWCGDLKVPVRLHAARSWSPTPRGSLHYYICSFTSCHSQYPSSFTTHTFPSLFPSQLLRPDNFAFFDTHHTKLTDIHASLRKLSFSSIVALPKYIQRTRHIIRYAMRSYIPGNMNCKGNGHGVLVIQKPKPPPPPSNGRLQQNAPTSKSFTLTLNGFL